MLNLAERSVLDAAKPGLVVHSDAALNAETPLRLLDAALTPVAAFFVRNNGALPAPPTGEWRLAIDGEVERPLTLDLAELQAQFPVVRVTAVLECAGNGRAGFRAPTDGLQWSLGAVGCAEWTGVRMADVLRAAGVRPGAQYVAHHSPDLATQGPPGPAISRGLPLAKALAPETLLAFEMNGAPLTLLHGAPLRVVAPGFPGSAWQKWLTRLEVRDREHDGMKMNGTDYRLPRVPLEPGKPWGDTPFDVITDMPVRAMITSPLAGFALGPGDPLAVRGFAWGGHVPPARVEVSADGGASWTAAELESGPEGMAFAWRRFAAELPSPAPGQVQLMARATDQLGRSQPLDSAPWNPRGYCNNGVQVVVGEVGGGRGEG